MDPIARRLPVAQDKDLPVILSNLGMAYGGVGEYQEAITMLQQAAILKPAAGTYMELGTDLAQVGRIEEATATSDKIPTADPTAKNVPAGCYKNIAIGLMNQGKLAEAIRPLQKATELNPRDASAWKLLGDALSNTVTTKSEDGKIVYVIPAGPSRRTRNTCSWSRADRTRDRCGRRWKGLRG
jgi:Flp pilus assembly protein TadD